MKSIGYAFSNVYRCQHGAYKVKICAPSHQTALEAFEIFLKDRNVAVETLSKFKVVRVESKDQAPLLWAQVDVGAIPLPAKGEHLKGT